MRRSCHVCDELVFCQEKTVEWVEPNDQEIVHQDQREVVRYDLQEVVH